LPQLLDGLAEGSSPLPDVAVTDLAFDSRRVKPGCLYFGLPGLKVHGASFAEVAHQAGAIAMVTDPAGALLAGDAGLPVWQAPRPRLAMALAAKRLFGDPTGTRLTFGVTGTAGKTTTCLMLDAALRASGFHSGYVGSLGFWLDGRSLPMQRSTPTTPESVDLQAMLAAMGERGADSFVMEASSVGLDLDRLAGVSFDVVGFTNLGRDHLDYHGTIEAYFQAKAKLFQPGWAGQAVINTDDAFGQRLAHMIESAGNPGLTTVGRLGDADWRLLDNQAIVGATGAIGQRISYQHDGQTCQVDLAMPGDFNAANAVLALAMAQAAGLPESDARAGIGQLTAQGRMQRIDLGETGPQVIVDMAHTPDAVAAALRAVARPSVAVVGCGGDRDKGKRGITGGVAAANCDILIVTDDNPRTEDPAAIRAAILEGAAGAGAQVYEVVPRQQAVKTALTMAKPGWTVVVLGRGDEEYQEVAGRLAPLYDPDVVRAAWREILEGCS